ncbi:(2Fe-2S)-binding protein [bacterium]|nr:(2Fe-2S)-binding protein [bacterium]
MLPEHKVYEVAAGDSVLNAVEAVNGELPFGCHHGTCSTCMTRVVSGMENLDPPNEQEKSTLSDFDAEPDQRLMCCRDPRGHHGRLFVVTGE